MCSRVMVMILLAMSRNHGTMSFVFGPLAVFTSTQDVSSPAPSVSTLQWTFGTDATTVTTATTSVVRRRPTANRRRPSHGSSNIVFPSDHDVSQFTESPILNSQDIKDYGVLTQDRSSENTEQHFWPGLTPRPVRPKPASHGSSNIFFPSDDDVSQFTESPILNSQDIKDYGVLTQDQSSEYTEQRFWPGLTPRPVRPKPAGQRLDDAIVFEGSSSLQDVGGRRRVGPSGRPLVFEPPAIASEVKDRRRVRPTGRPLVFRQPAIRPDVTTPGFPSNLAAELVSPPPPCPCPTTSESNSVCAEIQGARVTMFNMSEFKCAQMCVGDADVKFLFHGTCQKTINKLNPFIHD